MSPRSFWIWSSSGCELDGQLKPAVKNEHSEAYSGLLQPCRGGGFPTNGLRVEHPPDRARATTDMYDTPHGMRALPQQILESEAQHGRPGGVVVDAGIDPFAQRRLVAESDGGVADEDIDVAVVPLDPIAEGEDGLVFGQIEVDQAGSTGVVA